MEQTSTFTPGWRDDEVLDKFEAAPAGHVQIGQDEIGLLALHRAERVGGIRRGGADFEVGLRVEHHFVAVQYHGMVIHDEEAEFGAGALALKPSILITAIYSGKLRVP
jgi:hypothetical protein